MNAVDPATFAKSATRALETSFAQTGEAVFAGHVLDPRDLQNKFTVELLIDGYVVQTTRADLPTPTLAGEPVGDGCHGFLFSLPVSAMDAGAILEARLANLGTPVGTPIAIDPDRPPAAPDRTHPGNLRWLGGLRFSAWIADEDPRAEVLVDSQPVLQVQPTGWASVGVNRERAARTFDFHLPERFADGALHRVAVKNARGEMLAGCPLAFVVFADGLARTIDGFGGLEGERLRAELFDRLLPMSWPMARYADWRLRFPMAAAPGDTAKIAVVLIGDDAADETIESLEAQAGARWVAGVLPATDRALGFAPEQMNDFLTGEGEDCSIVVLAPCGTRFAANGLQRLAAGFNRSTETFAAYGDLEMSGDDGSPWPLLFPAFDYERMLEQGYCSLVFALTRSHLQDALQAGAADLFRLLNAQFDGGLSAAGGVVHVPGAVATLPRMNARAAAKTLAKASADHLRRRGMDSDVVVQRGARLLPSVRVSRRQVAAGIALVIATDGRNDALSTCLAAILPEAKRHDAEVIVADVRHAHGRTIAALAVPDGTAATVVTIDGPFCLARVANLAARSTGRDHLCFLADDLSATEDGWLDELLGRIADPTVGAVGPLAIGTGGLVHDAGIVLGPGFATAPAFADALDGADGYGGMLPVAHQHSALGMDCLLTRRGDYLAVGGMDEIQFAADLAGVDFCLKLRAAGRRLVTTPHARIFRAARPRSTVPEAARRAEAALRVLRARWGDVLAADPYYNPLLSLDPIPYSALAWPPRDSAPRRLETPVPSPIPAGF